MKNSFEVEHNLLVEILLGSVPQLEDLSAELVQ